MPTPPPLLPQKKPILPSCPSFYFKCIIDSPRGFQLGTSDLCISCFNQINPTSSYLLYHHHANLIFNSLQYSTFYYIIFVYRCVVSTFFHSLNIFFPSLVSHTPIVPSDTLTDTILFSLSLYICICTYYIYDHICTYMYV
jgi:hypothetical protein